ncbi:hypothetical protein PR048_016656 [Dryococelus australis]|uniref:Uncharacterized protein n=1 Tax=Dryococelus australis TaxID=614101 RepID=A0ABQ9H7B3_9NEOP|nr:hypothetical protein PR048_016656 [Dryococelus australis]
MLDVTEQLEIPVGRQLMYDTDDHVDSGSQGSSDVSISQLTAYESSTTKVPNDFTSVTNGRLDAPTPGVSMSRGIREGEELWGNCSEHCMSPQVTNKSFTYFRILTLSAWVAMPMAELLWAAHPKRSMVLVNVMSDVANGCTAVGNPPTEVAGAVGVMPEEVYDTAVATISFGVPKTVRCRIRIMQHLHDTQHQCIFGRSGSRHSVNQNMDRKIDSVDWKIDVSELMNNKIAWTRKLTVNERTDSLNERLDSVKRNVDQEDKLRSTPIELANVNSEEKVEVCRQCSHHTGGAAVLQCGYATARHTAVTARTRLTRILHIGVCFGTVIQQPISETRSLWPTAKNNYKFHIREILACPVVPEIGLAIEVAVNKSRERNTLINAKSNPTTSSKILAEPDKSASVDAWRASTTSHGHRPDVGPQDSVPCFRNSRTDDPSSVVIELNLDNCRSTSIVGLTDEFVNLETLSLINVGLTNLKGFPNLPNLEKVHAALASGQSVEESWQGTTLSRTH